MEKDTREIRHTPAYGWRNREANREEQVFPHGHEGIELAQSTISGKLTVCSGTLKNFTAVHGASVKMPAGESSLHVIA